MPRRPRQRHAARMTGGDISLESVLGKRSMFTIELPAIVAKKAAS
ncbi:hypothetical protein QUA70_20590 [Microcoleus sp. LAD1_D5]